MRFRSDDQRRAMFANMNDFARRRGKSNLEMFTDELGRLRVSSDTTADTSFLLSTDMDPADTKKFIEELDEEALAGLKRVSIVRPKVMQEYNAVPGYYAGSEEKVPFGRIDAPKIVVTAERRGRGGANFVPGVAKEIGRAAFQNMYKTTYESGEEGVAITSDLPQDLLEEEYLMQVYSDYTPKKDILERMEPLKGDLSDEVWRLRALQRLEHPSTLEARAWRMGKQPKVDVETFVDVPRRKYEKSGLYTKEAKENVGTSVSPASVSADDFDAAKYLDAVVSGEDVGGDDTKTLDDFYNKGRSLTRQLVDLQSKHTPVRREIIRGKEDAIADALIDDVYEPTKAKDVRVESWVKDSDVGFKTMADLMLSGKDVVSRLSNDNLDGLLDYTTGHFNPGYRVVRDRVLAEKDRRGLNEV